ncbi:MULTISPECIES: hypothetical protein [Bacillus]|uniref:hypothetical protein n=1 Tax=Bacillus TaxID=1386 RepID=UPI00032FA5FD|nr:hypothetical protein KQ1_05607 [Bacillus cereus BAG3O-1]MBJ8115656.1 hypothetical protein [Bacillus cereus]RFB22653.1 hypothetical protein DZB85_20305 [Bacillus sp. LB(2018)]RFB41965.1 hypothetical protein DZB83_27800 [Bacillus sp. dmp10]PEW41232.1 hypothetical protein CN431_16295 [Bacillus cereus]
MKKFLRVILILLVIFIGIMLGSIILNKTYHTEFKSLNETDQNMLKELSTIYKSFEESNDKLWNKDYHFEKKPLVLIHSNKDGGFFRQEAYAVNVKGVENSILAKEIKVPNSLHLPKVYRLTRFDFRTVSTWMPWNFGTININDMDVFYFKYYPKMFVNPDLYFDFSSFLLHEAFHAYKQKDWTYDSNGGEYIHEYPINKENYALMGLEFKLLDKAMVDTNPENINQALYDWTIVRNYRYKKWPQLIGETKTEAIEGSARYLEYRYSKLTGGKLMVLAKKEKPYHVTFMEAFNFIANGQAESPRFLERNMRYETGSALELSMDRANIPWKEAIEDSATKQGKTPYEVLNTYFNINNTPTIENKINEIKEKNDYDALLEQGEKLMKINNE